MSSSPHASKYLPRVATITHPPNRSFLRRVSNMNETTLHRSRIVKLEKRVVSLADCSFEILTSDGDFVGLGRVNIGNTVVRSGRLPLRPSTQTFKDAMELESLKLLELKSDNNELRIRT